MEAPDYTISEGDEVMYCAKVGRIKKIGLVHKPSEDRTIPFVMIELGISPLWVLGSGIAELKKLNGSKD